MPTAEQAGVDLDVAVDGIDELLTGFYTRGRSKLAGEEPLTIAVASTDADRAWTLAVADGRLTTERRRLTDATSTLTGSASQLYLGLWNRGEEISENGQPGVLERWREVQRCPLVVTPAGGRIHRACRSPVPAVTSGRPAVL